MFGRYGNPSYYKYMKKGQEPQILFAPLFTMEN